MKSQVKKRIVNGAGARTLCRAVVCLATFLCSSMASADDWPTYMYDNARMGVTTESLDVSTLNQSWVYTSPAPPRPAFSGPAPWDPQHGSTSEYGTGVYPIPPARDFDTAFFVTVVGDSVYFGSSVTDSVHCLNIASGAPKWIYTTDGPVRFPPSYHNDKLYLGSDDGYVHCINASDGSLVWKYSPAAADGKALRRIGNNAKAVPLWPIRTGAAVHDGKVYFAASMTPWDNCYLCSVDAETGAEVFRVEPVGNARFRENMKYLTPMGAILVSPSKIYLAQGRHCPWAYDRQTGKTLGPLQVTDHAAVHEYNADGGTYCLLTPDYQRLISGRSGLYTQTETLREFNADTFAYYPGSNTYAARMVISDSRAYVTKITSVEAINRTNGQSLWSTTGLDYAPYVLIKAGDLLFVGGAEKVVAYDSANGSEVWSKTVSGRVRGLTAANGHLFASTDSGFIYTFGATPRTLAQK